MNSEKKFEIIRTLVAIIIALMIAFIIIVFVSKEPLHTLSTFLIGPIKKLRYFGNVVELATPLIFSGLATAILFETGLFNLGSEGIFFFSGLLAAIVAMNMNLPIIIHPLVAIGVGIVFGGLIMVIIGVFRAKWNASELVMSLMFNSILFGIGLYIFNYFYRDPDITGFASFKMQPNALLSDIIPKTRIHSGLIIALITVWIVYMFLYRTKYGLAIRMTGINREFAEYTGINTTKVIIISSLVAGLIAGLGGSVEVLGMYERFRWSYLPGLGFDGALVAMLAKNKPINVVFSALFLAYIRIGADMMARMTDVPAEMVFIIQAVIILLISGERFLQGYRHKMLLKEAQKHE